MSKMNNSRLEKPGKYTLYILILKFCQRLFLKYTLYILKKDLLTMFTYNTIEAKRKCV